MLKYEVQNIDGTSDSAIKALRLIINEFKSERQISKSVEFGFFEEFSKCLLNWVGKGEANEIRKSYNEFKQVIYENSELGNAFIGTDSIKRVGILLSTLVDIMEVYLRSDLEAKDLLFIMGSTKKQGNLRKLLHELFQLNRPFAISDIDGLKIGIERKTLVRYIENDLINSGFVKKIYLSPKKIIYELTSKSFYFKEKIFENIQENAQESIAFIINPKELAKRLSEYRHVTN